MTSSGESGDTWREESGKRVESKQCISLPGACLRRSQHLLQGASPLLEQGPNCCCFLSIFLGVSNLRLHSTAAPHENGDGVNSPHRNFRNH